MKYKRKFRCGELDCYLSSLHIPASLLSIIIKFFAREGVTQDVTIGVVYRDYPLTVFEIASGVG